MRGISSANVQVELEALQIPFEQHTVDAFKLPGRWRVRRGGGIAGNARFWCITDGSFSTGLARNRSELRAFLQDYLKLKALPREADVSVWVQNQINVIEADSRYHDKPASVQVNAPLALIQVSLKTRLQVLQQIQILLKEGSR